MLRVRKDLVTFIAANNSMRLFATQKNYNVHSLEDIIITHERELDLHKLNPRDYYNKITQIIKNGEIVTTTHVISPTDDLATAINKMDDNYFAGKDSLSKLFRHN